MIRSLTQLTTACIMRRSLTRCSAQLTADVMNSLSRCTIAHAEIARESGGGAEDTLKMCHSVAAGSPSNTASQWLAREIISAESMRCNVALSSKWRSFRKRMRWKMQNDEILLMCRRTVMWQSMISPRSRAEAACQTSRFQTEDLFQGHVWLSLISNQTRWNRHFEKAEFRDNYMTLYIKLFIALQRLWIHREKHLLQNIYNYLPTSEKINIKSYQWI